MHWRFFEHERKLREFGEMIDARLATVSLPGAISSLYSGATPTLTSGGFGKQIRNLYDSLACNDILDLRVASLEYNSWDSHKSQKSLFGPKLEDMFDDGKGFDTLYNELPSDAKQNLTIVISGEFDRQLRANGGAGTDHGRGNAIILVLLQCDNNGCSESGSGWPQGASRREGLSPLPRGAAPRTAASRLARRACPR